MPSPCSATTPGTCQINAREAADRQFVSEILNDDELVSRADPEAAPTRSRSAPLVREIRMEVVMLQIDAPPGSVTGQIVATRHPCHAIRDVPNRAGTTFAGIHPLVGHSQQP